MVTDEGWVYLALVIDLFSRKLVGWSVDSFVEMQLTLAALRMVLGQRHSAGILVHHADRRVQYSAAAYPRVLEGHGITF